MPTNPSDRAARSARELERAQADVARKREKALRDEVAAAKAAQKELTRQRDALRKVEAEVRRTEQLVRRAARTGAGSVIQGPHSRRLSSSAISRTTSQSRATIQSAIKKVDQSLRAAMAAEKRANEERRKSR